MKGLGFIKDALILFIITLVAGVGLGFVYDLTKGPIAEARMAAKSEAYRKVFSSADKFAENPGARGAIAFFSQEMSSLSVGNIEIQEAVNALDGSGQTIGHVVLVTSKDGFSGEIQLSVGVDTEGVVQGIAFLVLNETPGLGMKAQEETFYGQYAGKGPESFSVVKGSPSSEDQVEAISGATITSTAVTNAVNAALVLAQSLE